MGTPNRHARVTPIHLRFAPRWQTRSATEQLALAALAAHPSSWAKCSCAKPTAGDLAQLAPHLRAQDRGDGTIRPSSTLTRALKALVDAGLVIGRRGHRREHYRYELAPGALPARRWLLIPATALRLTAAEFRAAVAVVSTRGNRAAAARRLGVSRQAVAAHTKAAEAILGVNLAAIRRPQPGGNSSRARGTSLSHLEERGKGAVRDANGASPADDRRNGNPERQPRTAPVMETTERNRTASRRTRDGQHRNERPTLEPLPATAQRWIVRAGFGGYRFRSEAERDRIGCEALNVCRDPSVRQPHAVIAATLRDCRRDPDWDRLCQPGRATRLEWDALKAGVDVRRDAGGLYRRVPCARCGPSVTFRAPLDVPASCPVCGLMEGDDPALVPDHRDAQLGRELVSELTRTVSTEPERVETEDARRARLLREFAGSMPARQPAPLARVVSDPGPRSGGAEAIRQKFAAMGNGEAVA